MTDQEGVRPVACGYGLLGLCCDSCLRGPCRRSPFDDVGSGEPCWEDSDWIVANHLMERVALESLRAMAAYRDSVELASDPERQEETARIEAMKVLLSPFSRDRNVLLDILSPEEAFPFFYYGDVPVGSWMTMLLGTMSVRPPARRDPEAILTDALRLSAMALAAEALVLEPTGSTPGEIDVALPDAPSPLLLLVSDEDGLRDDGWEAQETQKTQKAQKTLINKIDSACRKEARIYRLPNVALLPSFARRVSVKWGIPLSMTRSIAVVFSSSLIRGMGALALGFSLVSLPGYPIQGSPIVEKFLTQNLKNKFGHAYLTIPPREDASEAILRSLRS
jgi:hypothetical protein